MARSVRNDFVRMQCDFAGRVEGAAEDSDSDDQGFENKRTDNPTDDGITRVLLAPCREELLVHHLVAQHQQHGRNEEFERANQAHGDGSSAPVEESR